MTATILGCGPSLIHAKKHGRVIGSNDCEKHGMSCDILVLANGQHKFKDEPERTKVILNTKADVWVTNKLEWPGLPNANQLTRLIHFNGNVRKGWIYKSMTTPIICCSMAINEGATNLILYGVDLVDHKTFSVKSRLGFMERNLYLDYFKGCNKAGISVHLGAAGTAFDEHLPLWNEPVHSNA